MIGMGKLSRPFGVAQIDCIKFRIEPASRSPFAFLDFVGRDVSFCVGACAFAIGFVLAKFEPRKLAHALKSVVEPLFGIQSSQEYRACALLCLWLTVYWLFQQLFGGDLFSNMTTPPGVKVIDSWRDLSQRPNLKIVAFTDIGAAGRDASGQAMDFDLNTALTKGSFGNIDQYRIFLSITRVLSIQEILIFRTF